MKIDLPIIESDIFRLIETIEFDLTICNHFFPVRIELFQNTETPSQFRCRMWEREFCHMQDALISHDEERPCRDEFDEEIMVERTWEISDEFEDFEAPNPEKALEIFISNVTDYFRQCCKNISAEEE
ncbi:MAG: hypothetical protein K9N52_01925 [Verrucomicrobia bacterium]|nr:hypothetical protein [Verrucomicrobiota bacterium]